MSLSRSHKFFIPVLTMVMAAMVAMSPFAIDTYIAALPDIADFFGVKLNVAELTITLYFLGFAFGNFFGGPLSDAFGRKTIALTGIALYGIASLLITTCTKIEYVFVLRVLQAFGGGFATVTGNVFIRDWYSGKQVARFVTIISMIIMLAPLFAPVLGAGLIHWFGWESIFWFLFAFAILLFLSMALLIPESRSKELITRKITGRQLLEKYRIFFSNKQSTILLFAISLPMSGLYIFITAASFIYIEYFGISQLNFPIFFGANVVLNILLSFLNTILLRKYDPEQILRFGLLLQLISGIILAVSVLMPDPQLWSVFGGIVLFVGSLGLVFGNGTATILNHNPEVAGSANATIGIARFAISALIGSIMALFHTGDLVPFGLVLFFCTLSGNILYTWALRIKS
ncbi:multidrug effflux MFS transporter [Draconibacterium sp. IB214405]|uniref:multidrug effflux MFS transporter n=1 Tax=Draconibacterium sp. IB214405 TaxID=3097352 RepID=UPI002A13B7C4|nr:multidrug effflux MFS transporter [Draconibacterium sp. IB214405]MDX8338901.1 multidrug effflux MFS transporter [Draconibacterium sp. IB214405]